ncbi:hypothetical protein AAE478_005304 [Parahypoxylon ruwenzoriense]
MEFSGGGNNEISHQQGSEPQARSPQPVAQVSDESLLDKVVAKFYVEFFKVATDGTSVGDNANSTNHAVLKVDFGENLGNYKGARISMDINFEASSTGSDGGEPSYKPGELILKPVSYISVSNRSARTCETTIKQGVRLGEIMECISSQGLNDFSFVTINDRYYGCRDFMKGLINPGIIWSFPNTPELPKGIVSVFETLGMRFSDKAYSACPVDKGRFHSYTRIENSEQLPYLGSEKAAQIQSMVHAALSEPR